MGIDWHDVALGMAGVIGSGVAIVHGVLTQRLMVGPFEQLAVGKISAPIRRLVPMLLQFSTFNWFVGGIALIVAATRLEHEARLATGLLVGSSYLFSQALISYRANFARDIESLENRVREIAASGQRRYLLVVR
jgi:hypothetical protein